MALNIKKYNPGFLTDDELISSFCVRMGEFESIIETLHDTGASSNAHTVVIGPRGSGKTHLLLRVAAEVRREAALAGLFPIVFAEESYEVATTGEFWLECLGLLAEQAPAAERDDLRLSYNDLRSMPLEDDRGLAERCLGSLLDFADRQGKRPLLVVENLNTLFAEMSDPYMGWRLRKTLQTEPRIFLLGSATSRFAEIDHPEHALYDLFRVITLHPLDTGECEALWSTVSGQPAGTQPARPLQILTGGNPRLIAVIAGFEAAYSFRELMDNLLDLVDEHTEYFKSHLDALPQQERRVYLALARLWKPATAREVAQLARVDVHKCSAQLNRLVDRGAVAIEGGTARRRQYYLTERMYNIYYLLRRPSGESQVVEALIRFMASYYSPTDLVNIGVGMVRDSDGADPWLRELQHAAFKILVDLPEVDTLDVAVPIADALLAEARTLARDGVIQPALDRYDEVIRNFGGRDAPEMVTAEAVALVRKGVLLCRLGRIDEGWASYARGAPSRQIADLHRVDGFLELLASEDSDSSVWGLGLLEIIGLLGLVRMHDVLREIDELLAQGLPPETDDGHFLKMLAFTIKGQLVALSGLTLSEVEAVELLANPTFLGGNPIGPQSMQVLLEFIASIPPSKALELIEDSPIGYALLPAVVALRNELGQETSVAREVAEVAQDIRSGFGEIRSVQAARAASPLLDIGRSKRCSQKT